MKSMEDYMVVQVSDDLGSALYEVGDQEIGPLGTLRYSHGYVGASSEFASSGAVEVVGWTEHVADEAPSALNALIGAETLQPTESPGTHSDEVVALAIAARRARRRWMEENPY